MFEEDLQFGLRNQTEVANALRRYFNVEESKGYDRDKDMTLNGMVEVKTDRQAHLTGNIAIEVEDRGHKSGIVTTKSKSWAIMTVEGCWLVPVEDLRTMMCFGKRVAAGDEKKAVNVLVPYDKIKRFLKLL